MGAHTPPNLNAFEADKKAQIEAALRRTELIEVLRGHVGRAVCIKGFPSWATFSTEIDVPTGRPGLVSAPVYSILAKSEEREPRELEDVALLDVVQDAQLGQMVVVSAVGPLESQSRQMQPNAFQGYKFTLNRISELRFSEVSTEAEA